MRRALILTLALAPWASMAQDTPTRLSRTGADFGQVIVPSEPTDFQAVVDISGDQPERPFVVARFQNNQPLMQNADGAWAPWDGDEASLQPTQVTHSGNQIQYTVAMRTLPATYLPVTFSVGYWTNGVMVFGHFTVTEP